MIEKEKLFELFNLFIENEEYPIIGDNGYNYYPNGSGFSGAHMYNQTHLSDHSENWAFLHTYSLVRPAKGGSLYVDQDDFDFEFDQTKVNTGFINISLYFSSQPPLLIKSDTSFKKVQLDTISIKRNGFNLFNPYAKVNVDKCEVLKIDYSISFGDVKFQLTEDEFKSAFEKVKMLKENRESKMLELNLDQKLKEYGKES